MTDIFEPEQRHEMMSHNRSENTSIEMRVRHLLHSVGPASKKFARISRYYFEKAQLVHFRKWVLLASPPRL